jgi:UTP:GlnB (protein PII) uridylyltransferase
MSSDPSTVAGASGADPSTLRAQMAALLATARDEYVAAARAGRGGRATQVRYAAAVDDLVRGLADRAVQGTMHPFVVCALGGYGCRTLCLNSDIDVLVVFDGPIGPNGSASSRLCSSRSGI